MRRVVFALSLASLVALAGGRVTLGQTKSNGNPFIDHSDTGETIHILPAPAAIHSRHDTQPTDAPPRNGLHVYPASYGSGNLINHGGHQIPFAGFFAIYNGQDIKYAVFPYTNCTGCSLPGKAVADMLTIVSSHEIREAVTDPDLNAWYDAAGDEADDKCAWHNLYQMTRGGYWVQPEYSNGGNSTYPGPGCVVPQ